MKITPRKEEVKAVVALLESDEYDSAEALAKDAIKLVAELLAEREMYAYLWRDRPGGLTLAWGPFTSDTEVTRFAKRAELGGEHASLKLNSAPALLARATDMENISKNCSTCGHPHGTHRHEKRLGRCQVPCCKCTTDTE